MDVDGGNPGDLLERLQRRGLMTDDEKLTDAGRAFREEIEVRTDELERPIVEAIGDDLDELLTNAAVFVLPSDLEGLSLALLDAMAAGVCVLASDIPENQEVVSGVGFTFKHGDRSDLTRVLDLLLRNPELRRQVAARGAQHIQEHYLWPDIAGSIEKTYFDVLGRNHPADALSESARPRSSAA
jgi:glycosyltransferase involved in cell wall biosynthesis